MMSIFTPVATKFWFTFMPKRRNNSGQRRCVWRKSVTSFPVAHTGEANYRSRSFLTIFLCSLLSAELWSVKKYGKIFVETERAAWQIDHLLPQGATFYEWGNESGFYFSNRHRPSSGVFLAEPMLAGPLVAKLSRRLIGDLERTKPDLIVVEKATSRQSIGHPVMNWIEANYR